MYEDKDTEGKFPFSWKKSFETGVVIPKKERNSCHCNGSYLCKECD